jgi:alpha-L-fucosidase
MAHMPVPTKQQAAWQDYEIGMFFHYDLNVFMVEKWPDWDHRHYDNWPEPGIYNPKKLDTEQWMEAAKAIGAKYAVLTASHGTGFMQWQSDAYPFGMRESPFQNGQGDLVRDFVESCRRHGIAPGLYSHLKCNGYWRADHPGLVNKGKGGDPERQAEFAKARITMCRELWGNYGPLAEIWFDGAIPDPELVGYDVLPLLCEMQPDAMIFQGPLTTIRWIGNERGEANYPCWAPVPSVAEAESWEARGMNERLTTGDPDGSTWLPGECDVPLRKGEWMWKPGQEDLIKSVDDLIGVYERSVGRNCNLLINANPDPDGLVPQADIQRYKEFGAALRQRFGESAAETSGRGTMVELPLPHPTVVDRAIIMEEIAHGERIREYVLEGSVEGVWTPIAHGQSVGHKRIEQFPPVKASRIRLRVTKATAEPLVRRLAAFEA